MKYNKKANKINKNKKIKTSENINKDKFGMRINPKRKRPGRPKLFNGGVVFSVLV